MSNWNATAKAALQQMQEKSNRELQQMFYGDTMPSYMDLLHRPQWLASQYDPYHYINAYNTTPTKEKPPVTSSTLNDMTVAELEALAERTANTLREKKEKKKERAIVNFCVGKNDYTFDKQDNTLTCIGVWTPHKTSVFQATVAAFVSSNFSDVIRARNELTEILGHIIPTLKN